jgi:hypothetical protein
MEFTPHVMHRVRSRKLGEPEQVMISNIAEQIQFCREEGLVPPTDLLTIETAVASTRKIKQLTMEQVLEDYYYKQHGGNPVHTSDDASSLFTMRIKEEIPTKIAEELSNKYKQGVPTTDSAGVATPKKTTLGKRIKYKLIQFLS